MKERPILFSGPMVRAIREGRKTQTRRLVKPQPPPWCRKMHHNDREGWWVPLADMNRGLLDRRGAAAHRRAPEHYHRSPYGAPGDRLWVRETWATLSGPGERAALVYQADRAVRDVDMHGLKPELLRMLGLSPDRPPLPDGVEVTWRPSIHMPRWASRLTLAIEAVRVERLQEISEADARAEGVDWASPEYLPPDDGDREDPREVGYPSAAASFARDNFRRLWDSLNGERAPWESNPWVWVITFRVLP